MVIYLIACIVAFVATVIYSLVTDFRRHTLLIRGLDEIKAQLRSAQKRL